MDTIPADLAQAGGAKVLLQVLQQRQVAVHTLINNAGFGLRGSFEAVAWPQASSMLEEDAIRFRTDNSRSSVMGWFHQALGWPRAGRIAAHGTLAASGSNTRAFRILSRPSGRFVTR